MKAIELVGDASAFGPMLLGSITLVYLLGRAAISRSKAPLIDAATGLLGGTLAGFALFVVARVAMRLVALAAGLETVLTLGGNLFLLFGCIVSMGMPAGVLFVVGHHRFAGSRTAQGLAYGAVLFVVFFPAFYDFGAGDLVGSGVPTRLMAVGFVSLSWLLFGLALSSVVARLDRATG